jgi:hypothetical protein
MAEKTLNDIYRDIENEVEEECFDKEDLKLKDQDPYVIVGKSITSGNILLKVGDELGYDVTKTLTFPEAMKLIKDLTNAIIEKYTK